MTQLKKLLCTADATTKIEPRFWRFNVSRGINDKLYGFFIFDLDWGGFGDIKSLSDLGKEAGSEQGDHFIFNVNPQSIDMAEPHSVQIVPTQNGGRFIESQGQLLKDITISGTTGMRPNRVPDVFSEGFSLNLGGVVDFGKVPIPSALDNRTRDKRGLLPGEKTGYEDFFSLRNVFRHYWSIKQNPVLANSAVLVWANAYEGEFYVVEPINFTTQRASNSPLTFRYQITLKTIERLDLSLIFPEDPVKKPAFLNEALARLKQANQILRAAISVVSNALSRIAALGKDVVNTLIAPLLTLLSGAQAIISGARDIVSIASFTKRAILSLKAAAEAVQADLNRDWIERDANPAIPPRPPGSDDLRNAIQGVAKIQQALEAIYTNDMVFERAQSMRLASAREAYYNPFTGYPTSGGSSMNLENAPMLDNAKEAVVRGNETIMDIARRELGDGGRAKEIILFNNLKAPYISKKGGPGVLKPGDKILIPIPDETDFNSNVSVINQDARMQAQSKMEKQLGRDLYLKSTGEHQLQDLTINSQGDLDIIDGKENMAQAIFLRATTEQGELATHPFYGMLYGIGSKSIPTNIIEFNMLARAQFLSDPRISSINSMSMGVVGDKMELDASLRIRGIDENISFTTAIGTV